MRLEREKLKAKNPKSLEDFEMPEDNDYNDWSETKIFWQNLILIRIYLFFIMWN